MIQAIIYIIGGSGEGVLSALSWSNFFYSHTVFSENLAKQECIPVGCIPPAHWPYLRISSYPTHAPPNNHAHPWATMHPPGATMHAPWEQPCMPPLEQPRMPARATMHPPGEQPCMPSWEQPCMPPKCNHAPPRATMHAPQATTHTPLWTECGHTLLKILPCPNFVAGGNNSFSPQAQGLAAPSEKSWTRHCVLNKIPRIIRKGLWRRWRDEAQCWEARINHCRPSISTINLCVVIF